jgi:hypothetical protein
MKDKKEHKKESMKMKEMPMAKCDMKPAKKKKK